MYSNSVKYIGLSLVAVVSYIVQENILRENISQLCNLKKMCEIFYFYTIMFHAGNFLFFLQIFMPLKLLLLLLNFEFVKGGQIL